MIAQYRNAAVVADRNYGQRLSRTATIVGDDEHKIIACVKGSHVLDTDASNYVLGIVLCRHRIGEGHSVICMLRDCSLSLKGKALL